MGLRPTTDPRIPDTLLLTVKQQLRYTSTNLDKEIHDLIRTAVEMAERYTGRAIFNRTYIYTLKDFPSHSIIYLPRAPLSSLTSITYVDTDGATQTWASTNYNVGTNSLDEIKIELDDDSDYPDVKEDLPEAVTITYVAGYGTKESDLPQWLKQGIVMIASHLFNTREAGSLGDIEKIKESFLHPYRIHNF